MGPAVVKELQMKEPHVYGREHQAVSGHCTRCGETETHPVHATGSRALGVLDRIMRSDHVFYVDVSAEIMAELFAGGRHMHYTLAEGVPGAKLIGVEFNPEDDGEGHEIVRLWLAHESVVNRPGERRPGIRPLLRSYKCGEECETEAGTKSCG